MAFTYHPKYRDLVGTIETYVLGAYRSDFSVRFERELETALTPHQLKLIRQATRSTAIVAVRGYVRILKHHRNVERTKKRRALRRAEKNRGKQ